MIKKLGLAVILIGLVYIIYACGDLPNSVNGKVISGLSISPATASLSVGSSEAFYATATFTDGTTGGIKPAWSVTNNLGTITALFTAVGYFTATAEGTGAVIASAGGFTATAEIAVTAGSTPEPGGLTSIEVSPATLDMPVGGSQTFTATGLSASGESIPLAPSWSLTGASVGTFTFSGTTATLEATKTGSAVISCSSGEITATVPVTIEGHIVTITVEADTYVDEINHTTTYEGSTSLKAGLVSNSPVDHQETYLFFSLTSLPAGITSIESVQLEVYASGADSPSFSLYSLSSAFSAATIWDTKPTQGSYIQSATFTVGQYNVLNSDALLSAIRGWYATPATNYGLEIVAGAATTGVVTLVSKEDTSSGHPPILIITYK